MSNGNNTLGFSPDDFAPRGEIALSPDALDQARTFLANMEKYDPTSKWIIGFSWADERKLRPDSHSDWVDIGPGVDLCAYKPSELPDGVAENRDGLEVAFIVPRDKIQAAVEKKIISVKSVRGNPAVKLV
jgi:hypothetical protein